MARILTGGQLSSTTPSTTALFCAIAIALGSLAPDDAHALRVNYTLDFSAEHNDNLLLTPTDPLETTILRPGLGVEVLHDTSVLQMHLSGRADYRYYDTRGLQGGVDGTFSGRVNWVAIPERLSFTVVDQLTLQPVDTLAADAPGNRQQVNVLSAGPTLQFEWGDDWRGSAELRYIRSQAEVTDEFNSKRTDMALRATRRLSAASRFSFNLQHQRVDFDSEDVARDYDRTQFFARWTRTLNRVDMAVDLGYSRLDYRRSLPGFANSRADPMFRASAAWRPNDAHRFDLSYSSLFSDVASDSLSVPPRSRCRRRTWRPATPWSTHRPSSNAGSKANTAGPRRAGPSASRPSSTGCATRTPTSSTRTATAPAWKRAGVRDATCWSASRARWTTTATSISIATTRHDAIRSTCATTGYATGAACSPLRATSAAVPNRASAPTRTWSRWR